MFRTISCFILGAVSRLVFIVYYLLAIVFVIAWVVAVVALAVAVVLSIFAIAEAVAVIALSIFVIAVLVALACAASAIALAIFVLLPAFFIMRVLSCPPAYFPNPSDPFDFLRLASLSAARGSERFNATDWPFLPRHSWFPWPIPQETTFPIISGGFGLLELLFLPNEQISKLHPNMVMFVDCLRRCLCAVLCQVETRSSVGSGGKGDPGKVVVDTSKTFLEDLKGQLDGARKKLEEARHKSPPDLEAVTYWTEKITELTAKIAQSCG